MHPQEIPPLLGRAEKSGFPIVPPLLFLERFGMETREIVFSRFYSATPQGDSAFHTTPDAILADVKAATTQSLDMLATVEKTMHVDMPRLAEVLRSVHYIIEHFPEEAHAFAVFLRSCAISREIKHLDEAAAAGLVATTGQEGQAK